MNMNDLFSMSSESDSEDLGVLYSTSVETLRMFGGAYMQAETAKGSLKILDPKGVLLSSYDYWQGSSIDAADGAS